MSSALYFAAIVPDEPVLSAVRQMKEEFRDRFGCRAALKSPAHITLLPPASLDASALAQLQDILRVVAAGQEPFQIHLQNFSCFPPRVIYADVMPQPQLNALQEKLSGMVRAQIPVYAAKPDLLHFHPHMTIANRDLKEEDFETAWNDFRKRNFEAEFSALGIRLFEHDGKVWNAVGDFGFVT